MQRVVICLDVGGTQIKAATVNEHGGILTPIRLVDACAGLASEQLLDHFTKIIREQVSLSPDMKIAGVHMAFPGPFDYQHGISLMRGLDKFDGLYGVDLPHELSGRLKILGLTAKDFRFINDVHAFALGEMRYGKAAGAPKAMFICIGTGCGSAFGINGSVTDERTPGVPRQGYIYLTAFLDGCVDDYLSKRGLMNLTRELLGVPLDGKQLAQLAQSGDRRAADCFQVFGERVRDALVPFLHSYRPDCLCIGGQITKSASLFLNPLAAFCHAQHINLYVTDNTSQMTIMGLADFEQSGFGGKHNEPSC